MASVQEPISVSFLIGGAALGGSIAFLVAFFLNRFDVFNTKALGSVVSVIAGGVVTAFLGVSKQASWVGYAWVGYCCGLFVVLLFLVTFDQLVISSPVAKSGEDPRLKMLDELRERYLRDVIDKTQFEAAKAEILAGIGTHPPPK